MSGMPGYPCPVCRRAGGEVTLSVSGQPLQQICSIECARIFMSGKKLDMNEEVAVIEGGKLGGQYLEQIGEFDLRRLTPDQWAAFCGKIFQGTCEAMKRMADDEIPF